MALSRKEMADLIKGMEGRILVTTHKNPDGDAVGSSLGWFNFLRNMGKNVEVAYSQKVPYFLDFLPGLEDAKITTKLEEEYDWLLITDVSEISRTGFETVKAKNVVVLDHHVTAEPDSDLCLVEPDASSACELSYEVMLLIDPSMITYRVVLPIYTGILTDTGNFTHSNTTARTFEVASQLVKKGVNPHAVSSSLYGRNRINRFRLLSVVLETLELRFGGKVACITVKREFLEKTGTTIEEADGFINFPRSIKGVEIAVMFKEMGENLWKVSLRSKGRINVALIAKDMGGGGHVGAAGYEASGSYESIRKALFEKFKNLF